MIVLNISKDIFSPKLYPLLEDYSHRWELYMGSAGSGKSYFITMKCLLRALKEKINILVCRRYGTTIRNSTFSLFKELIEKWKISDLCKINESDFRIKLVNGSQIIFTSLDEESKLLSFNNLGTVFIEEVTECTKAIVQQLNLRLRGSNENQQILMSWNPISKHHWLYDFAEINPPESSILIKSTYKDNPWLSDQYIKALEELYTRDPQKARVYCDGEWGIDAEGLVFTNWTTDSLNPDELAKKYEHRAGCDFGYRDPSAVCECFYDADNRTIYITDEFYRTGQTLDELAAAIKRMHLDRTKLYCDSAEPRTVDFLKSQQIRAIPCIKGQNSVAARIAFLQNNRIIIDEKCENVINEFSNFSYIKDKNGNFTQNTTHEFSHAVDAISYAFSDIYSRGNKIRVLDKAILGV